MKNTGITTFSFRNVEKKPYYRHVTFDRKKKQHREMEKSLKELRNRERESSRQKDVQKSERYKLYISVHRVKGEYNISDRDRE